jgi:biopolymer transport protein ExbD
MTPMIDVVFQLIIFFIVTITMTENRNEDIRLERSIHGLEIKSDENSSPLTLVIEVDRKGRVSIRNVAMSHAQLAGIIDHRHRKYNVFPIMIRADYRTKHVHVKNVMDICTGLGIGRVSFVAVKDPRTPESKARWSN